MNDWFEKLDDLRRRLGDSYWRADHPEVNAIIVAVIGGVLGLMFVWLELRLRNRYTVPRTGDV